MRALGHLRVRLPEGAKSPFDLAYWPHAQRAGAQIVTGARVRRIATNSRGWSRPAIWLGSMPALSTASAQVVVLCANGVGMLRLLLLSDPPRPPARPGQLLRAGRGEEISSHAPELQRRGLLRRRSAEPPRPGRSAHSAACSSTRPTSTAASSGVARWICLPTLDRRNQSKPTWSAGHDEGRAEIP